MHDSIGFDMAYTLYSDPSSEKRSPSLQQPRLAWRGRSIKVAYTCCFCLIWKVLQLCGRKVSTNLGPVSRENPFRVYFGCHKSRPIFKMTTFHFKSSNSTITPLFSCSKQVTQLAQKTIDPFKKNKTKQRMNPNR